MTMTEQKKLLILIAVMALVAVIVCVYFYPRPILPSGATGVEVSLATFTDQRVVLSESQQNEIIACLSNEKMQRTVSSQRFGKGPLICVLDIYSGQKPICTIRLMDGNISDVSDFRHAFQIVNSDRVTKDLYQIINPDQQQNSFASFFDGVSVREDAEAIAPYFPWIQIEACQWQAVTLVNDRVPGPTDTLIWGCIAVSRDYLDEIIEKYDWFTYEDDYYITMKTDLADANKPNLKYSPEYKKEHEGEQNGAAIQLYFDFDVGVIYFSGSL